ncbi:MAG: penicillin-binding protein 2 [Gammaproteobacteria bacterium]|nr:penicillin-binding protein 2 [Gammaproteobacteria bacterium]
MQSGIPLRDHFRETRMFNIRVIVTLAISLLLILLIIVRLVYLQIIDHELYTTLSEENRFFISAIPPTRGLIYDRNDVLLAQNLPTFNLELIPERIENIDNTIAALGEIIEITVADIKRFKEQMGQYNRFKSIPLRTRLSDEEVARIAVNRYRFPGVDIAARLIRHYPHGELTSHTIGYVGRINDKETQRINKSNYEGTNYIGKTGIEKYYEDILHGHVGVQQVETNAQGRSLRTFEQVPAESGINLHLSLDIEMQKIAQEAMGEESGSIVAIDPNTGNVLVFVSTPAFDPNLFVAGIDHATYKAYRDHPQNPLFNRTLRGQYPPGSTIKPFWGLAGLEFGVATNEIKTFCRGWFSLPGHKHRYRDWKKTGHGKMDLHDAIVQSCDVYFYDLALTLGIDRMAKFMAPFGFNSPTGIDITGELGGLMPTPRWKQKQRKQPWYLGETLIAGIGQGYVLTTPLQLASATATLSKSGQRMLPRVVTKLENTNTAEITELAPIFQTPVTLSDPEYWLKMIDAMKDVTHHWRGTAYRIGKKSKYKIAGKTGTAQVFSVKQNEEYDEDKIAKTLRDHALFIAFAPVEEPQIAISIIVEHGGHGGSTAAPIAKKIMDYYLLPKLEKEEATAVKQSAS